MRRIIFKFLNFNLWREASRQDIVNQGERGVHLPSRPTLTFLNRIENLTESLTEGEEFYNLKGRNGASWRRGGRRMRACWGGRGEGLALGDTLPWHCRPKAAFPCPRKIRARPQRYKGNPCKLPRCAPEVPAAFPHQDAIPPIYCRLGKENRRKG